MKRIFVIAILALHAIGCGGSNETILPTDKLSAEQIEKVKAEDKAVADAEGGRK